MRKRVALTCKVSDARTKSRSSARRMWRNKSNSPCTSLWLRSPQFRSKTSPSTYSAPPSYEDLKHSSTETMATVYRPSDILAPNGLQARVARAAHGKLRAVVQHHDAAILGVRLDPGDALQVDDIGAVNAGESRRIELPFYARYGLLLQIVFLVAAERDVVVLRFDVIELGDGDDVHFGPVLHYDALQLLPRRAAAANSAAGGCAWPRRLRARSRAVLKRSR